MNDKAIWQPLQAALKRWEDAGKVAHFWFRDDDAVSPSDPLDRLLALSAQFSIPMTLAVIPAFTGEALSARLAGEERVTVAVHGWSHENHASASEKKQELGSHRPAAEVLALLGEGFVKLRSLHGMKFAPVLVPPWNRIASGLLPELSGLGYRALSVYGAAKQAPLASINTHVDIMDWHGTGGCKPHTAIVADMVRELERCFAGSGEPIGLLTHHLVHDEAAWDFIATAADIIASSKAARWHAVGDFLG
jgi:hypothetical protein